LRENEEFVAVFAEKQAIREVYYLVTLSAAKWAKVDIIHPAFV